MVLRITVAALICTTAALAAGPLKFERIKISDRTYEACSACDVNKDGAIDIVSGAYWYIGPDFKASHKMCDVAASGEYFDDFSDFPMDVDGDGYLDIITGGWWGKKLKWRQNPKGKPGPWKVHDVDETGNVETIRFWDVDRDGHLDVVPNAGGRLVVYRLVRDAKGKPAGKFAEHVLMASGVGHGMGFGDVNGDGRGDFIIPAGWVEAPADPWKGKWTLHQEFNLGTASDPILVIDVNDDGLADLIVGEAHNYGLYWLEQKRDASGKRAWVKHMIDPDRSQYHDVTLADLDNDGKVELITGKRYRAHNGHDPGAGDPVGVYYFEIDGGKFKRVTLDYGPAKSASGVGIYPWVTDVDGDGWKDIIAPGKEGLYLFKNHGPKK
jgi:hypothetical protein